MLSSCTSRFQTHFCINFSPLPCTPTCHFSAQVIFVVKNNDMYVHVHTLLQTAVNFSNWNVLTQSSASHLDTVYVTTFNIWADGTSFAELEGRTSSAFSNPMSIKLGSPERNAHVCVKNGQSGDHETDSKNDTWKHSSELTPPIYLTQLLKYSTTEFHCFTVHFNSLYITVQLMQLFVLKH
jgi:hypothetical protein